MLTNNTYPFKFWCAKVLPLVYDDSLSYYEVVCKIAKDLQTVIEHDLEQDEDIETLKGDVFDFNTHLDELKKCIALDYDPNNMYSKGMYCIMNNDLYVCEESTTGEFDRNAWTHTDFGSQLASTNNDITSMDFRVVYVENAIERIDGTIGEIQSDITTINSRIESVITKLAPTYNASLNYSVGQYCTHLRGLYKCTQNTTGEFDISCWDSTDVGYNLSDLYSKYETLNVIVNAVTNTLKDVRNISANEYNKTATYNEGDYCTHGWVMYKCNSDNVTGNFDDTYWDETTVGEELILAMNSGGGSGNPIPAFDPTRSYVKYSFVTYNDNVYMCITNTQTAGSFIVSEWAQMPINDALMSTFWQTVGEGMYSPLSAYKKGELVGYYDTNLDGDKMYTIGEASYDLDPYDTPAFTGVSLVSTINKLWRALSMFNVDTYDSTKTYNVGDIIINYVGECMKCTVNGTTGDYDFHNWTETDMFTELAEMKHRLLTLNVYQNEMSDTLYDNVTEGV